ncbi:unnamed protein product [Zymoseptoria tritici ST99CH_3D1]|nr:unnamed protein product [Zymoseptoria tritici ST99CH_3D1]
MIQVIKFFIRASGQVFAGTSEGVVWICRGIQAWLQLSLRQDKVILTDSAGCRNIIQAKVVQRPGSEAQLKNLIPPFESRAKPNKRLVHAFGINNCFTTAEPQRCTTFRLEATRLIRLRGPEWKELSQTVLQVVKHSVPLQTQAKSNLFNLMQIVTMKSILGPLCGFDSSRSDVDGELQTLAKEINRQWLDSKEGLEKETEFANQPKLKSALKAIAPTWDGLDDTHNPLNFILPGYETLWRVVLRGFLEVMYRANERDSANWRHALEDFALNPTLAQLDKVHTDYGKVSTCMIVEETLRLYPPTRRIYRTFKVAEDEEFEAAADIEGLHRSAAAWGNDALFFNPSRWADKVNDTNFRNDNFMPFGTKPFTCVAKTGLVNEAREKCLPFGVSIIAILLGCFSAEVPAGMTPGGGGADGTWSTDQPLKTGREDYRDVMIGY